MGISKARLKIKVVKGEGTGVTTLSAFDGALKTAGVYNYNLITLSSIIPPNSKVEKVDKYISPEAEFGHKLYVVMAQERSNETGKFIAAGIGWYQLAGGKGLFVEHHIKGDTKEAVKSELKFLIENSLKDLCQFRDIGFDKEKMDSEISITQVESHPACVLVLAVYQSEGWA